MRYVEKVAPFLVFALFFGAAYAWKSGWFSDDLVEVPLPQAVAAPEEVVEALLLADSLRVAADTALAVGEPLTSCGEPTGGATTTFSAPCWKALGAPASAEGHWWLTVEGATFAVHGQLGDVTILADAQPARRVTP